jgi:hypothetical protein
MRRPFLMLCLVLGALAFAPAALASGASYTFVGGTPAEQATVHAALDASSFNWGLLPQSIVVHVGAYGDSYSTYGAVYLDASLLDSGVFSWGVVQHEFAHQVDFFLLDDAKRAQLAVRLGTPDWCYGVPDLEHADYGCERFASELSWAYWQSPDNTLRPESAADEAGAIPPAAFRTLLAQLVGAPQTAPSTVPAKAQAPVTNRKR